MDDTHFLHDPAAKSKFGNAIRDIYFRLDATLGKFLEYAGPTHRSLSFRTMTAVQSLIGPFI
jgi:predicted AlkP superfamily phosphohydrolase/phosphomutase